MLIIITPQRGKRTTLVVDVAGYVQVAGDLYSSVILELQEASRLMHQPEFAGGSRWRTRKTAERAAHYDSMLGIPLLGQNQNLIAG